MIIINDYILVNSSSGLTVQFIVIFITEETYAAQTALNQAFKEYNVSKLSSTTQ